LADYKIHIMINIRIQFILLLFLGFLFQVQAQMDSISGKALGLPDSVKVAMIGKMPKFQGGGDAEFAKYIQETMVYPWDARRKRITGTAYVEYVIDIDGSVINVRTVPGKELYPSLDQTAVSAVITSPKWEPGTNNGVPVRVRKIICIKFDIPR